ncbi:MAG TPA: hypothetical protein VN764_16235, partial [Polyangiaceae bacterium]|nr:hypothetical protein [Polyangiaceae bacterium]
MGQDTQEIVTNHGGSWYGAAMQMRGLVSVVALLVGCLQFTGGCAATPKSTATAQEASTQSSAEPTKDAPGAQSTPLMQDAQPPQQPLEPAVAAQAPPMARNIQLCSDVWSPYTDAQGKPRLALDL